MRRPARILLLAVLCLLALVSAAQAADPPVIDRMSFGPAGGNGPAGATLNALANNGSCVVFSTNEALTSDDGDGIPNGIYRRCGANLALVAAGSSSFFAASNDTQTILYSGRGGATLTSSGALGGTPLALTPSGSCAAYDDGSIKTTCGTTVGDGGATFRALSADGSCVAFTTGSSLAADDTDGGSVDVYTQCGATVTQASENRTPPPDPTEENQNPQPPPDPQINAAFNWISGDGSCVGFSTSEQLHPSDPAGAKIYQRCGTGDPQLVLANASFAAANPSGSCIVVSTTASLDATKDTDGGAADLYKDCGGAITMVSQSNDPANAAAASFAAISQSGDCVTFESSAPIVPADTDQVNDVYQTCGGQTTRLSLGPAGGNTDNKPAFFAGQNASGGAVLIRSSEALTGDDSDAADDLYLRQGDTTTHASAGRGTLGNGPFGASSSGLVSDDGATVAFATSESLVKDDTDASADVYELHAAPELFPDPAEPPSASGGGGGGGAGGGGGGFVLQTPPRTSGAPSAQAPSADHTPPLLRQLAMVPSTMARGGTATLQFSLSERAKLLFVIQRRVRGYKHRARCQATVPRSVRRAQNRRERAKHGRRHRKGGRHARPHVKRCMLWLNVGKPVSGGADQGLSRLSFGAGTLLSGKYRIVALAEDDAGNRGSPVSTRFKIR